MNTSAESMSRRSRIGIIWLFVLTISFVPALFRNVGHPDTLTLLKKVGDKYAKAAYAQQAFDPTVVGGLQVQPSIQTANIGNGIVLHYVDQGRGTPLIFVHGSLSDGGYWADQIGQFAEHYRAIAYSRRYNYPNSNPARAGYSAVADADDLAAFIRTLRLGQGRGDRSLLRCAHSLVSSSQPQRTCARSCLG